MSLQKYIDTFLELILLVVQIIVDDVRDILSFDLRAIFYFNYRKINFCPAIHTDINNQEFLLKYYNFQHISQSEKTALFHKLATYR